MATARFKIKALSKRRRDKRDDLWPDAEFVAYSPFLGGWSQSPRTLPMICSLIDLMSSRETPGRVYSVLWSYDFGDGFVEVTDPALFALEAGYLSSRAERSFEERMTTLVDLGFIRTAPFGLRKHGSVLLLDPHAVVLGIREKTPEKIPPEWWSAFEHKCAQMGLPLVTRKKEAAPSTETEEPTSTLPPRMRKRLTKNIATDILEVHVEPATEPEK